MSPEDGPVSIALLLGLTGVIMFSGLLPVGAVASPSATTTTTTTHVPWQCFDAREDATYAVVERINESERQAYNVDTVVTFENLSDDGQEIIRTALRLDCKVKQSLWDISNRIVIRNGTCYLVSVRTGQRMTTLVTSSETTTTTTVTPPVTTSTTSQSAGTPECLSEDESGRFITAHPLTEAETATLSPGSIADFENLSANAAPVRAAIEKECYLKFSKGTGIPPHYIRYNGTVYRISVGHISGRTTSTTTTTTAATTTTSPPTTTTTTTTPGGQPGFTLTLALLAVVGVAGLTMRQR